MTLETELLQRAVAAGRRLAESEREALLARGDYHHAIRRLHLAGASLREIGHALALSHQRVKQIVDGAGGTWWQKVWRTRNVRRDAVCTYCGQPPSQVQKLIAGPNVFICDGCVAAAARVLVPDGVDAAPFAAQRGRARTGCSFCGLKPAALAVAAEASVCADCLRLCREILEQKGGRT
jgi:hypothetical protein